MATRVFSFDPSIPDAFGHRQGSPSAYRAGHGKRPPASLGWIVCNIRERAGFTIQELAPRAGMTTARLAAIERDCAGRVSREEIEALARVAFAKLLAAGLEGL